MSRTHGMSRTKAHNTWEGMKGRCLNPNSAAFQYYGGRGVRVCDRWVNSFENFLADMGVPEAGMSIERIDVNGDYEPGNCKWIPMSEQARNKRNVRLENGKTLVEIAAESGVAYKTLHQRRRTGVSSSEARDLRVTYFECGGLRLSLAEWAARAGVAKASINQRIKRGWPLDRALGVSP